jgi:thiamine biosynthesis lipoprotein
VKVRVAVLAVWLVACATAEPEPAAAYATLDGEAFGAGWTLTWRVGPGSSEAEVGEATTAVLSEVDAAMSTWREDSELSAVRRGGAVAVSEETAEVVRAALEIAEATGGAFDPTVEPLMRLWGFHGPPPEVWPSAEAIAEARTTVDWRRVSVGRGPGGEPVVDGGGTAIDVSSIAPGHAADRVATRLSQLGVTDLFVEVGGEVRAHGRSPRGEPWRVGVERPEAGLPKGTLLFGLSFTNEAVATSGNYRSHHEIAGRRVHHTMDPRTGEPAQTEVLSATVLAPDCRTADGWATALMVLDPEAGRRQIEARPQLEAVWVVRGAAGYELRLSAGLSVDRVKLLADDVKLVGD